MLAPEKLWWKPMGRHEKTWLTVAFVWCVFLTVMMPLWYFMGKQNVPTETYRVTPSQFNETVTAFVEQYKVGEDVVSGFDACRKPDQPIGNLDAGAFVTIVRKAAGADAAVHYGFGVAAHGVNIAAPAEFG